MYGDKSLTPTIKLPTGGYSSNLPYFVSKEQFEYLRVEKNMSWREIKEEIGWTFSERQLWERAKALGWNTEKCSYDISPLFKDSKFLYWFLGLMLTDGYIRESGLLIKLKDKDVIDKLFEAFSYKGKRPTQKGKSSYYIFSLTNRDAVKRLVDLGVTMDNKTFKAELPKVPDEYLWDFIRGVVDGDGCFYLNPYKTLRFDIATASEKFANQLHELFMANGIDCSLKKVDGSKRSRKVCYHVYGNHKGALTLGRLIYKNSEPSVRMDRKYELFKNYLEDYKSREASKHNKYYREFIGLITEISEEIA